MPRATQTCRLLPWRRLPPSAAAAATPAGYKIPRGGLFEYVSAANYSGEVLEWAGWALGAWSGSGAAFAAFTFSNLAPRAVAHHQWYLDKFGAEYPRSRRAIIPLLW